jgi:hypothetical protein
MPTSVRLNPAVEARLERLAEATGRSKAYYLRELIEQGLEDLECPASTPLAARLSNCRRASSRDCTTPVLSNRWTFPDGGGKGEADARHLRQGRLKVCPARPWRRRRGQVCSQGQAIRDARDHCCRR